MIIAQILQSAFGTVKPPSIITLMTNSGQFIFPFSLFLKFRQRGEPLRSLNLDGLVKIAKDLIATDYGCGRLNVGYKELEKIVAGNTSTTKNTLRTVAEEHA